RRSMAGRPRRGPTVADRGSPRPLRAGRGDNRGSGDRDGLDPLRPSRRSRLPRRAAGPRRPRGRARAPAEEELRSEERLRGRDVPREALTVDAKSLVDYAASLDCIHCGLCVSSCPTWKLTGVESSSPRGRVHLMRAVAEGELAPDADYVEEMEFCLL